ncbi:MAG: tRNA uridine-5-carboxymethylaminomethyl(34) synthesis GTPase MnmE [Buchnera aphidicola (Eriosoma harunire)]
MTSQDTIVAQATPIGISSVGILRISGSKTRMLTKIILGKIPIPRYATFSLFKNQNNNVLDHGIAIWFPAPNSFTGEDVLELQGHGSPIVLDLLIKNIISIPGVRIANPGEFSERAFLNNKLDLIQAEAIADLIHATSEKAAQLSLESLTGIFSKEINNLMQKITTLQVEIEGSINFIELEENNFSQDHIVNILNDILNHCKNIELKSKRGSIFREKIKIVITGEPNVGKSSLFNALCGSNTAIVTNIKGTTRDTLKEYINIHNVTFQLVDTAGLHQTKDEIDSIGIERAWQEINKSDHIIFVMSATDSVIKQKKIYLQYIDLFPKNCSITILINKTDLLKRKNTFLENQQYPVLYVSSLTLDGFNQLNQHFITLLGMHNDTEGIFLARRRHLNKLHQINKILSKTKKNWLICQNIELLAEDINIVQKKLGEITGTVSNEKLLDNIFSTFCLGK